MMKSLIVFLLSVTAMEAFADVLYRCQFSAGRKGKEPFVMTGHIVGSDKEDITYLSLLPPTVTGIPFEARVLITGGEWGGYNPMTIHPRGITASPVAHAELDGDGNEIQHADANGNKYLLSCARVN